MFVKRNPGRKGPPNKQIYVPHDQRELNPSPIPIRTLKEAEFYYKQLQGMGLINPPVDNYKPEMIVIKKIQSNVWISFDMNENQSIKTANISADTCDAYDLGGHLLDKTKYDLVNILNMNGYTLYPLLGRGQITLMNGTQTAKNIHDKYIDSNTSNSISVAANTNYNISTHHGGEWNIAYPLCQEGYLMWVDYSDMYTTATPFMYYGLATQFNLRCYELYVLVV